MQEQNNNNNNNIESEYYAPDFLSEMKCAAIGNDSEDYVSCPSGTSIEVELAKPSGRSLGTWDTGAFPLQTCSSDRYLYPGDPIWSNSQNANHLCCIMEGKASISIPNQPPAPSISSLILSHPKPTPTPAPNLSEQCLPCQQCPQCPQTAQHMTPVQTKQYSIFSYHHYFAGWILILVILCTISTGYIYMVHNNPNQVFYGMAFIILFTILAIIFLTIKPHK